MNEKLTKWAAAAVLSIGATVPALGGSVTEPGETLGLPNGTPAPPGFFLANELNYGCRGTSPQPTCVLVDVPWVA